MMIRAIKAVDAWLQKRFDAAVHAFMRKTGASKRAIRRNGWGLAIASMIGQEALHEFSWLGLFSTAVLALVYSMQLYGDDICDARAESAGYRIASVADSNAMLRKIAGLCFFLSPGISFFAFPLALPPWVIFQITFALAYTFQGYLCGVAPQAPKKKPAEARAPLFAMLRRAG